MSTLINNLLIVFGFKRHTVPPRVTVAPAYIRTALERAAIKWLPNDKIYYGEIPGFQGVWATGDTEDAARAALADVLEDWTAFRLGRGMSVPNMDGQTSAVHA